jgi:hypothetical protein
MSITQLTTVARLKGYLRLDPAKPSADDSLFADLVVSASTAIQNAISQNIFSVAYNETYNGTGTSTLMLGNTPVSSVTAVSIIAPLQFPSAVQQSTPLVANVDYTFTQWAVKLLRGRFPRGVANVAVAYVAGYTSVPMDLISAATKYAALRYREIERLGQKSKLLAGETVAFDLSEFPPDVQAVINRYSTKIPVIGRSTTATGSLAIGAGGLVGDTGATIG